MNERDGPGIIDGRRRVGHTDQRSEAAARRGGRAGGNGFLRHLARLAKMHMQINQTGAHHQPIHWHPLRVRRRLTWSFWPDCGDPALNNKHIPKRIEAIGGINHPTPREQQRIHAGSLLWKGRKASAWCIDNSPPRVTISPVAGVAQW